MLITGAGVLGEERGNHCVFNHRGRGTRGRRG